MIYVLFRSEQDAQIDQTGKAWISQLNGLDVDDSIGPHGGIILKELVLSSPTHVKTTTDVAGYMPDGSPVTSEKKQARTRRVLRTFPGEGDPIRGKTPTAYVCEPDLWDAEELAGLRDWSFVAFKSEDQVPRNVGIEEVVADVESPVVADEDTGPTQAEQMKAMHAEKEPLKVRVRELMAAGAPQIAMTFSADKLRAYIAEHESEFGSGRPKTTLSPPTQPEEHRQDSAVTQAAVSE